MNKINDFEIVEHVGNGYVIAKCKECFNQWETYIYTLKNKKSCGCNSWKQLKPLPKFINGFRTIKCHGYDRKRNVRWATVECKECKRIYECDPNKLQYRQHCGCMKKGVIACKYVKLYPQLAQAYKHMIARCYNVKNQDYYNYGERGITVCKEWLKDRNLFCEWALKNGYENNKKLSLDRIDGKKGYSPKNCRWSSGTEQARNTRRNVLTMEKARQIRKERTTMTYREMSKKYRVSYATIYNVVNNISWKE